ncbi:GNAT family N-acetyltransferase [Paracidovorax konjaci]|nr:GNAT family N-acetyltransferase [Paracidovorax konjaci]
MALDDHAPVLALMQATPGVSVREADSREATARYLARNPGLSFVAEAQGRIVGCLMAGHDGRRGSLQHLLVVPEHRRQGIAKALVEHCLDALEREGIFKSNIDIYRTNAVGLAFWERMGWVRRQDTHRYFHIRGDRPNA